MIEKIKKLTDNLPFYIPDGTELSLNYNVFRINLGCTVCTIRIENEVVEQAIYLKDTVINYSVGRESDIVKTTLSELLKKGKLWLMHRDSELVERNVQIIRIAQLGEKIKVNITKEVEWPEKN